MFLLQFSLIYLMEVINPKLMNTLILSLEKRLLQKQAASVLSAILGQELVQKQEPIKADLVLLL